MTERLRKILRKIVIEEISCVRKPANEHAKVLIMKSADTLPETGLDAVEMIKKMQANGDFEGFEKADYLDLLNGLAEEIQQDGESIQKAFVRGLETPAGVELFGLMKRSKGSEVVERDAKEDSVPKYDGPADAELNRLARERQKVSGRSFAQSFSDVLDMPGNRKLTIAAAAERDLKMVRSLTPQQARDLEPGVKPFPDYGSPGQRQPAATGRTQGSVVSGQRTQGERSY
jgi:hypothetical protein